MQITKVINNNVVSAYDDDNNEVVVMGRGIGFQKKNGEALEPGKIEKIFSLNSSSLTNQFKQLVADIPLEHLQLSTGIINQAKKLISCELSNNIYITLTDHINFAIYRYKNGMEFSNPLTWEIQQYYPKEFEAGMMAIGIIKDKLGIILNTDEAASIAMHFVNAQMDTHMTQAVEITKIMRNITKIVSYSFGAVFDKESLQYERFLLHVKFFARKVISGNTNSDSDEDLFDILKEKYPECYQCAEKIRTYIEKEYKVVVSDEEMTYLIVNLRRLPKI